MRLTFALRVRQLLLDGNRQVRTGLTVRRRITHRLLPLLPLPLVSKIPPIYFYLPEPYFPTTLPASADDPWKGFGVGIYAWTLQTYLRLKADGFPCELVQQLPESGIVLVHRNSLRVHDHLKPEKILLICLKADGIPYPYAQLHVVQNPLDRSPRSYYLPHWTQPGLIPRDPQRGDRFETIAYFGHKANLAPELQHPDWEKQLHRLGLHWQPILNRNHWNSDRLIEPRSNDYSQVDAVVAVRRFYQRQRHRQYINKPATKLYNAWLAGVPALMGCESAYQAERRSELDYLEVSSVDELLAALKRLQNDTQLRRAMVENGQVRAGAVHPAQVTAQWQRFLIDTAVPAYYRWRNQSSWTQHLSLEIRGLAFKANRLLEKVQSLFRPE